MVMLCQSRTVAPFVWSDPAHYAAVVALVACHDVGKFSEAFQSKRDECWPVSLGAHRDVSSRGHDELGFLMLRDDLSDVLLPLWEGWSSNSDRSALLRAIAGHHGRPPDGGEDFYWSTQVGPISIGSAREFIADVRRVLNPTPLPRPTKATLPGLVWWLAGLTVLADWIGSAEHWFPYHERNLSLDDYWNKVALPRAQKAVAAAGLDAALVAPHVSLADLVGGAVPLQPSPVQQLAVQMDLGHTGPALVLIEDQTGSGKTEAALLVAHRLMASGRAQGLFVALPTMATANGMYQRLADAYRRLFQPGSTPSLVLAHGRRRDHRGFQDSILRGAATSDQATNDPADETASAQCAAWIAEDRRRTFFAAVGVGTIDQALLGVLPSRHAPLRLQGLHQRVLIIDEAHAYDPYMRRGMRNLVRFHAGMGGSTVILSATLPQATRRELIEAHAEAIGQNLSKPTSQSYPLVTVAADNSVQEIPCAGRPELARSIRVRRLDTEQQAISRIIEAAAAGQAVAWIRNSVLDATAAWRALRDAGVEADLFHSRFAMGDRIKVENDVVERFGKCSNNRHGVVVATQVIEQSLDLDFDLLISDLAPMDLLIQRAGRLWRHVRPERSGEAELLVLSPPPIKDAPANWLGTELRRTGRVYQDHALLWRTAHFLFAQDRIFQPGDVRNLVEQTYDDETPYPSGLQRSANKAAGTKSAHESIAGQNFLKWDAGYTRNAGAWTSDIVTPTRLGEASMLLRLARWRNSELRPWYAGETEQESWSLSEIQMPQYLVSGVVQPAGEIGKALQTTKLRWGAWEQDIPVLVMQESNGVWQGDVLHKDRRRHAFYSASNGLWLE